MPTMWQIKLSLFTAVILKTEFEEFPILTHRLLAVQLIALIANFTQSIYCAYKDELIVCQIK